MKRSYFQRFQSRIRSARICSVSLNLHTWSIVFGYSFPGKLTIWHKHTQIVSRGTRIIVSDSAKNTARNFWDFYRTKPTFFSTDHFIKVAGKLFGTRFWKSSWIHLFHVPFVSTWIGFLILFCFHLFICTRNSRGTAATFLTKCQSAFPYLNITTAYCGKETLGRNLYPSRDAYLLQDSTGSPIYFVDEKIYAGSKAKYKYGIRVTAMALEFNTEVGRTRGQLYLQLSPRSSPHFSRRREFNSKEIFKTAFSSLSDVCILWQVISSSDVPRNNSIDNRKRGICKKIRKYRGLK